MCHPDRIRQPARSPLTPDPYQPSKESFRQRGVHPKPEACFLLKTKKPISCSAIFESLLRLPLAPPRPFGQAQGLCRKIAGHLRKPPPSNAQS